MQVEAGQPGGEPVVGCGGAGRAPASCDSAEPVTAGCDSAEPVTASCDSATPLTVRLTELGRVAGAGLRRRLEPLGLDARQYRVLAEVGALDGCPQRALTARLGIPPSRVVVILDGLEERGLVQRRDRPGDRRSYALGLTPAGRELLERARPLVDALDAALVGGFAGPDRQVLDRLLSRVAANCD